MRLLREADFGWRCSSATTGAERRAADGGLDLRFAGRPGFSRLVRPRPPVHPPHRLPLHRPGQPTKRTCSGCSRSSARPACTPGQRVEVLTNGARFYPAMLAAIREARHSINVEAYIFQPGRIADQIVDALADGPGPAWRSGSCWTPSAARACGGRRRPRRLDRRRAAGCDYYQPLKWYRLHRANNRTHRELLIVDGRIAFVGGAGVADWWHEASAPDDPAWRDTMVRVEGPVVASLQGVFAENWLECGGEILTSPACWPALDERRPGGRPRHPQLAVGPRHGVARRLSAADGVRARVDRHPHALFPSRSQRCAARSSRRSARGVRVRVLVPGPRTDQRLVRLASRRLYGQLLEKGVRIFEYQPGMTHAKSADDRRPLGDCRHDQLRQPVVRAQRRGERRVPRSRGRRRGCARTSRPTSRRASK